MQFEDFSVLLIFAGWFILMRWVFPAMGVPT